MASVESELRSYWAYRSYVFAMKASLMGFGIALASAVLTGITRWWFLLAPMFLGVAAVVAGIATMIVCFVPLNRWALRHLKTTANAQEFIRRSLSMQAILTSYVVRGSRGKKKR